MTLLRIHSPPPPTTLTQQTVLYHNKFTIFRTTVYHITLHCITSHHPTLPSPTPCYISSPHTTLPYTTLRHPALSPTNHHTPDPGFIVESIAADISFGAGRPGMSAVVIMMSLSDTHFVIASA